MTRFRECLWPRGCAAGSESFWCCSRWSLWSAPRKRASSSPPHTACRGIELAQKGRQRASARPPPMCTALRPSTLWTTGQDERVTTGVGAYARGAAEAPVTGRAAAWVDDDERVTTGPPFRDDFCTTALTCAGAAPPEGLPTRWPTVPVTHPIASALAPIASILLNVGLGRLPFMSVTVQALGKRKVIAASECPYIRPPQCALTVRLLT
jgi:hypothetical protein